MPQLSDTVIAVFSVAVVAGGALWLWGADAQAHHGRTEAAAGSRRPPGSVGHRRVTAEIHPT